MAEEDGRQMTERERAPKTNQTTSTTPAITQGGRRVGGGWEEGDRWEGGGKSEDRRRSLELKSIDRCRSNRFGHGIKSEDPQKEIPRRVSESIRNAQHHPLCF